jgi:hypothetical protein
MIGPFKIQLSESAEKLDIDALDESEKKNFNKWNTV